MPSLSHPSGPHGAPIGAPPDGAPARPHTPDAWAQVLAGGHLTRYHRLGAGPPVLLLDPATSAAGADVAAFDAPPADDRPADDHGLWPALAEALAGRLRVIAPAMLDAQGDPAAGAAWLRDFVDALGVAPVAVVAAPAHADAALALADDAERVSRAVVVTRDGAATAATSGTAAVPLLVLPRALARASALDAILPFLGAEGSPA